MKRILTLVLMLSAAAAAYSQDGGSARFLGINPDARTMSAGAVSSVAESSAWSIWNNGASGVFSADRMAVAASYGMWQPSAAAGKMISAAGSGRLSDRISLLAGAKYYMHRSYEISDSEGIYSGSFTPAEFSAGVGIAYRILPVLSASASVHYVHSDITGTGAASAVSADLGLLFKTDKVRAALTASNLGSRLNYGGTASYSLPSVAYAGVGYSPFGEAADHRLDIMAQAGMIFCDNAFVAAGGLEYRFRKLLRIAGGYNWCSGAPGFVSAGAGVSPWGVSVDLAWLVGTSEGSPMSNTLLLNLGYSF